MLRCSVAYHAVFVHVVFESFAKAHLMALTAPCVAHISILHACS